MDDHTSNKIVFAPQASFILRYSVVGIPIVFLWAANLKAICSVDAGYLIVLSIIIMLFIKKIIALCARSYLITLTLLNCAGLILYGLDKNRGYGYDASVFELAMFSLIALSFIAILVHKKYWFCAIIFATCVYLQLSYQALGIPADVLRQAIGKKCMPTEPHLYFTKIQANDIYAIAIHNNSPLTETLHYRKNPQDKYILLNKNSHQEGNEKIGGQYTFRTALFDFWVKFN